MKVVFSNGTEGRLSAEQSKKLYIQHRFTKESWEELENEMNRLNIVKFDDPFGRSVGARNMVSIEYVKLQIEAH